MMAHFRKLRFTMQTVGVLVVLLQIDCVLSQDLVKTKPKKYKVKEEDYKVVTLPCAIHTKEPYQYVFQPLTWQKIVGDEDFTMNNGIVVNEPFSASGRYSLKMKKRTLKNSMEETDFPLEIRNVSLEDNGVYRCKIKDAQGKLLGSVEHNITVIVPINGTLQLYSNNTKVSDKNGLTFTFKHGQPASIGCRAEGSHPAPKISIKKNNTDITGTFDTTTTTDKSGSTPLQRITFKKELKNMVFRGLKSEHGQVIKCESTVGDVEKYEYTTSAIIDVQYKPDFDCATKKDEDGHSVVCTVMANPPVNPNDVKWEREAGTEGNATADKELRGNHTDYFTNFTTTDEGHVRAEFTVKNASDPLYHVLTIKAGNLLGDNEKRVSLGPSVPVPVTTPVVPPKTNGNPGKVTGVAGGTTSVGQMLNYAFLVAPVLFSAILS